MTSRIIDHFESIQRQMGSFETYIDDEIIDIETKTIHNELSNHINVLTCTIDHYNNPHRNYPQIRSNSGSKWQCSGRYKPEMGLGPFKKLFNLNHHSDENQDDENDYYQFAATNNNIDDLYHHSNINENNNVYPTIEQTDYLNQIYDKQNNPTSSIATNSFEIDHNNNVFDDMNYEFQNQTHYDNVVVPSFSDFPYNEQQTQNSSIDHYGIDANQMQFDNLQQHSTTQNYYDYLIPPQEFSGTTTMMMTNNVYDVDGIDFDCFPPLPPPPPPPTITTMAVSYYTE
ncbi:uncharacterized protein LOC124493259 [Dermatophagoides farinae]|uniref:Uncharacterized protein n=1 Tax=Dermatophagoides farinae TaxID=6954 RepID=A0A922KZZ0_DERFA|nr:probable serine/threonine-protein kinase clkA [Dermatophagoides farinae]KAH7643523.1 hypothetical protein HUG17_5885 [Dermatophagoides farinae]KAH9506363.1 hypothetical protein DERF_011100 [Dermatophagoides farinae]